MLFGDHNRVICAQVTSSASITLLNECTQLDPIDKALESLWQKNKELPVMVFVMSEGEATAMFNAQGTIIY